METQSTKQQNLVTPVIPTVLPQRISELNYSILESNPQSFYDKLPVKNVAANFLSNSFSIGQLARLEEIGELKIQALLNIIITDVVLFFEVGKSMGASQVKQTVQLILEDYKHLKPEDFKLCFNRAKKGHYGKLYDRLDGQIILGWLMDYDNERDGEIESIRARENRLLKEQPTPLQQLLTGNENDQATNADIFKTNIEKLKQTLDANKKAREAQKVIPSQANRLKDPVYEMHQGWISQFEKIWKRQGYHKDRQVMRYGMVKNPFWFPNNNSEWRPKFIRRRLDINAWLDHKQWQYMLALTPRDKRMIIYLAKYNG